MSGEWRTRKHIDKKCAKGREGKVQAWDFPVPGSFFRIQ